MDLSLNKWEVYELIKGNSRYSYEQLNNTDKKEIIEGIKEYIGSRSINR